MGRCLLRRTRWLSWQGAHHAAEKVAQDAGCALETICAGVWPSHCAKRSTRFPLNPPLPCPGCYVQWLCFLESKKANFR